eukprot:COSAG02_NODE_350_length_24063_cov_47.131447_10_plen_102_part_00
MRAASRPSLTGPGIRGQSWLPEIAAPPPPSAFFFTSTAHSFADGNHGGLLQQLCVAVADCFLVLDAAAHFQSTTRLATPYDAMARMATTRPPRITAAKNRY